MFIQAVQVLFFQEMMLIFLSSEFLSFQIKRFKGINILTNCILKAFQKSMSKFQMFGTCLLLF